VFQQIVSNLNVLGGDGLVATGTNLSSGNIEFWGYNYAATNAAASRTRATACTTWAIRCPVTSGTYGSMQVHNHAVNATTNRQTIFAYNRFGYGGTSDLGIGNRPVDQPDWTFAQNAASYTSRTLLVLARPLDLPAMAWTNRPASLQLYPRDRVSNTATVRISGAVAATGCTQIALAVTRLGAAHSNAVQALTGAGGEPFDFSVPIAAELADYDFEVTVTRGGVPYVLLRADDVVAGDALLVSGQSNAEARQFSGSANSNQSAWIRSFGNRTTVGATVQADLGWYLAEGDAIHASGAIGQWPLRMARVLVESNGIPLAVINHAEGGQPISFFRRNDTTPEDLNTNYGQLLYRVRRAGLDQAVRALLWFQGESDTTNVQVHAAGFLSLCADWRADFAPLSGLYVCQLKNATCGGNNLAVREFQRTLPDQYPGFIAHATSGLQHHTDNCHYAYEPGYRVLGEQLARLLLRDLYGKPMPAQIAAPNIASAWFTDGSGAEVAFRTRNPEDVLSMGHGPQTNFAMEGVPAAAVLAVTAASNEVRVLFDRDVRAGTGLSFPGQPGGAPFLTNELGAGLLYFHNQPVAPALALPAAPAGLAAYAVRSNVIDLAWAGVSGAAGYVIQRDGGELGRAAAPWFRDATVTAGVTHAYRVAAQNPAGTSAWSTAVATSTVPHNVFRQVAEAADYDLLYAVDLPDSAQVGSAGRIAYATDASATLTAGIRRVAYHLELQGEPGTAPRWAYASMQAFSTNPLLLGVPSIASGAVFQQPVTDLNVYASGNAGVAPGLHLASGNIEFWGYNYGPFNQAGVPNASGAVYDFGDSNSIPTGTYGSMQVHAFDLDGAGAGTNGQTIFAWNRWGNGGVNDIGLGNDPDTARANWGPDYTFAQNAQSWNIRKLSVLVQADADGDGLPDAWERARLGDLSRGPADHDDGDGVDNGAEYVAGTDPADDADWLQARIDLAGGARVRFASVSGRLYDVYVTTSLVAQLWERVGDSIAGSGLDLIIPVTNGAPAAAFQLRAALP
jgi:hypothetical protein